MAQEHHLIHTSGISLLNALHMGREKVSMTTGLVSSEHLCEG